MIILINKYLATTFGKILPFGQETTGYKVRQKQESQQENEDFLSCKNSLSRFFLLPSCIDNILYFGRQDKDSVKICGLRITLFS